MPVVADNLGHGFGSRFALHCGLLLQNLDHIQSPRSSGHERGEGIPRNLRQPALRWFLAETFSEHISFF
jgi:hypothetical protein